MAHPQVGVPREHYMGRTNIDKETIRLALFDTAENLTAHIDANPEINVNMRTNEEDDWNSPLHYAVMKYDLAKVTALIEVGAQVNCVNKNGKMPIDMLFVGNDVDLVEEDLVALRDYLLEKHSPP